MVVVAVLILQPGLEILQTATVVPEVRPVMALVPNVGLETTPLPEITVQFGTPLEGVLPVRLTLVVLKHTD
jgi:hypothetical protein